jgi:hypothetical protein
MEGGRVARNGDPRGPLFEYDTLGFDISLMDLVKYVSPSVFSAVTGGSIKQKLSSVATSLLLQHPRTHSTSRSAKDPESLV